jgi:tetratricopeptide (TPR) repeat protein
VHQQGDIFMNDSGMKMGRMGRLGMIAAALVIASVNCAALSQTKAKSPYDSQDITKLGAELVRMGMEDILGQLVKEQGTDINKLRPDQLVLSAQYDMALADAMIDDVRDKKMDEAIAKLEKAVKAMETQVSAMKGKADSETCDKTLAQYQYQLMLARAVGLQKTDPYFGRAKNLLAGKRDIAVLGECTGKASEILKNLSDDLGTSIENWGALPLRPYRIVAENMKVDVGFCLAMVQYYHAVSMKDGTDKDRELTECQNAVERYAHPKEGDSDLGVKYVALVLCGRCHRELRQYADALVDLKAAMDPAAEASTRRDAQLEVIRCAIEEARAVSAKDAGAGKAKFMAAKVALEDFRKIGEKYTDPKQQAYHAFFAAVFENYLYETWAACDQSDEAKKEHAGLAEKAQMSWTLKYTDPGEQEWYVHQWSYKNGDTVTSSGTGTTSKPSTSGSALYLQAMNDYSKGIPVGNQEPTAEQRKMLEEADKMFEAIIQNRDESLASVRCQAMYKRGELLVKLRNNKEAAAVFAQVAKEYKGEAVAGKAALNVVMIWSGVIDELKSTGKEIVPKMRQVLVEAIDVLLGNPQWAKEDWAKPSTDIPGGILQYQFDRGFQCQKLAELDPANAASWFKRAVESYDQVPATAPEIMDARFSGIECRYGLIKATAGDVKAQGAELVKLADKFIGDCASQTAGKDKESANHLMNLEATAEFIKAKTLCDAMGQEAQGLAILGTLDTKYPDAGVIHDASEYEIERLITQGKIVGVDGAVEKAKAFSKKFPESGPYVMNKLITQIRDSISKLKATDAGSPRLASLRKDYLDFAKTLYESDKASDKAAVYRQIYGDALLENGQADEAITIFQQCLAEFEKTRAAQASAIDAQVKKRADEVKGDGEDAKKLKADGAAFFKKMDDEGMKVDDSMDAIRIKNALKALNEAGDNAQAELAARKAMVKFLSGGWPSLGLRLKARIAIDDVSIRGLGRAYFLKKQYADSLKYYRELDKVIFAGRVRWEIRAEHAQAAYENSKDNAKELENLGHLIGQWKGEDEKMGGPDLKTIFSTIENNINEKAPVKPASK